MGRSLPLPRQDIAIKMYYEKTELSNSDIKELFGGVSSSTISRLKNKVKDKMVEEGVYTWQPSNVNTKIAFKVWNLNVEEMEKNYRKLKRLGLIENVS